MRYRQHIVKILPVAYFEANSETGICFSVRRRVLVPYYPASPSYSETSGTYQFRRVWVVKVFVTLGSQLMWNILSLNLIRFVSTCRRRVRSFQFIVCNVLVAYAMVREPAMPASTFSSSCYYFLQ
jgi:hypothetical protein